MACKTTQKTLAEENSKLTRTIAELEESTADKLKKQQAQTATLPKMVLIPRPPGENGKRGWKLINHMGLGSAEGDDAAAEHAKKAEYNHALDVVRTAMGHAHWDFNRRSNKQDPGSIRTLNRLRCPLLGKFEYDWATHEIAMQYHQNMRHKERKRKKEEASGAPAPHNPNRDVDSSHNGEEGKGPDEDVLNAPSA
ncbi:hypothetical protein BOTBODRAFT_32040 [Botryobasidium botryosum FD-172 SS1]|uniref:Uncharacterized protein n=1 Tax=Botryobasidium botryosum (strain FD-172 SS1) TaxID=930990 RepID=A0A067MT44_BOTB1|nr:hypothetical protein BOTBODRAFT_32040 [Botryobasidium botryosum FD-172 SS1]